MFSFNSLKYVSKRKFVYLWKYLILKNKFRDELLMRIFLKIIIFIFVVFHTFKKKEQIRETDRAGSPDAIISKPNVVNANKSEHLTSEWLSKIKVSAMEHDSEPQLQCFYEIHNIFIKLTKDTEALLYDFLYYSFQSFPLYQK